MKKVFIGLAVLAVLVVYSHGIRDEQPKISTPSSLTVDNSSNGAGSTDTTPSNNGASSSRQSSSQSSSLYKDGSYTGSTENAYYGDVRVKTTISGGKITDVTFLQYPDTHSTSVYINKQAMPYLQQEAIKAQSANVNIISGATYTSQAFIQSLQNALSQAS
jgi:uncharacterized protein with FMN-binding domain